MFLGSSKLPFFSDTEILEKDSEIGHNSRGIGYITQKMFLEAGFPEKLKAAIRNNPYKDTPFELYYVLDSRTKGAFAQAFFMEYLAKLGFIVEKRKGADKGTDFIANGFRVDIKAALEMGITNKKTLFKTIQEWAWRINHLASKKDCERYLIFLGKLVYRNGVKEIEGELYWIDKIDFLNNRGTIFKHQQTGQAGENDDFTLIITSEEHYNELIEKKILRSLDEFGHKNQQK